MSEQAADNESLPPPCCSASFCASLKGNTTYSRTSFGTGRQTLPADSSTVPLCSKRTDTHTLTRITRLASPSLLQQPQQMSLPRSSVGSHCPQTLDKETLQQHLEHVGEAFLTAACTAGWFWDLDSFGLAFTKAWMEPIDKRSNPCALQMSFRLKLSKSQGSSIE